MRRKAIIKNNTRFTGKRCVGIANGALISLIYHEQEFQEYTDVLKKSLFNFTHEECVGGGEIKTEDSEVFKILIGNRYKLNKIEAEAKIKDFLKKYEIDVDIYVPFYSKLTILIEDIPKEEISEIEGFSVLSKEILLILKQGAELERGMSEKGEKDRLDILGLVFFCDIDYKKYEKLLKKYIKKDFYKRLISLTKGFKNYRYFNLTPRQLKLKKQEALHSMINGTKSR